MPIIIEGISDKAAGAAIHRYFIRFLESSRASLIVRYEVGKGRGAVYLNLQGVPKKMHFQNCHELASGDQHQCGSRELIMGGL